MVEPLYMGLFMMLNGKAVTGASMRIPQ
jgi:hypothetical protein